MKVWVVFSEEHLLGIIPRLRSHDLVICNSSKHRFPLVNIVNVNEKRFDDRHGVESVLSLFHGMNEKYGDAIMGFANNFHQCSLILLSRYLGAIDLCSKRYPDATFCFLNVVVFGSGVPNYYLAEYESQGVRFYDREAAMSSIAVQFCRGNKIKTSIEKRRIGAQIFYNFIRIWAVFFAKMLFDIRAARLFPKNESAAPFRNCLRFISRSRSQSTYLKKIIPKDAYDCCVGVVDSFLTKGHADFAEVLFEGEASVFVFPQSSVFMVLALYARIFIHIIFMPRTKMKVRSVRVDVTQSMKEVLVMYPHVLLYRNQLREYLARASHGQIVFSAEQKSPQAYVDALVAKEFDLKLVHLMQCDQDGSNLPIPIAGDMFVPISRKSADIFRESWLGCDKLIYFPGNVECEYAKSIGGQHEYYLCYFARFNSLNDFEYSASIVRHLSSLSEINNFKFLVKLHPRDGGQWLEKYISERCKMVKHSDIEQAALFELFDIAITDFSAVAISLLEYRKGYMLLNIGEHNSSIEELCYVDDLYKPVIENISDMDYWVHNPDKFLSEFERLHDRYVEKNGAPCSKGDYFSRIMDKLSMEERQ